MNADLKASAEAGDLKKICTEIKKDPYVLENIGKIPFVHTPLHVAAAAGHIRFATEITRLMPSLAHKLNEEGLSPMHLALQNVNMVRRFASIDKDLVRIKGRKGLTPLHFAAKTGQADILAVLLLACPDSIEDLTVKGETARHIAVRKRHFETLQVLVGWLRRYCSSQLRSRILYWKNESGDTVLHVSTRKNVARVLSVYVLGGK